MGNSRSKGAKDKKEERDILPPAYEYNACLDQTIERYAEYGSKWCLAVDLPKKWIEEFYVLVHTKTGQVLKPEALILLAHNYTNQVAATGSIHTFQAPSFFCQTSNSRSK